MTAGKDFGTANYPVYPASGGKAALLADLEAQLMRAEPNRDMLFEIVQRLNNTDTSTFSDPTATRT